MNHAFRITGLFLLLIQSVSLAVAPPQWTDSNIDFGIQNEGVAWSTVLTDYVKKDAGDTLSFTAVGLPAWMKFEPTTNKLSGTPDHGAAGNYAGIKLSVTGQGGQASATAHGTVKATVHPPSWVSHDAIALTADATENLDFSYDLKQYVLNTEGASLQFSPATALWPTWLHVGQASGLLYGTPSKDDLGPVTVAVQITAQIDNVPYQDVATFKFQVKHRNHPPAWLTKTIALPDAHTKQAYQQSLKSSVTDPDNDPLLFTMIGPAWLKIDPQSGIISGKPDVSDVTAFSQPSVWTVTATDPGKLSDSVQIQVKVIKSNEPPIWTTHPITLHDIAEDSPLSVDLSIYAKDPDGDTLTFTKLDGPSWITVSPRGILQGTPRTFDVGPVSFTVSVDDNISGSATTKVSFLVTPVNHPPFWSFQPIVLQATEDKPVTVDISSYAGDPDAGDKGKLLFSAIKGPTPAWAQISDKGVITGTPGSKSTGEQRYTIRVADLAGATADVDVIFNVVHVNHAPKWSALATTISPNAKEGAPFTYSVASLASDVDPQDQGKLTFEKAGAIPAWLTLGSDGTLSGTPQRRDVGTSSFQIRVIDPSAEQAVASFTLSVDLTKHAPKWRQNPVLLSKAYEGLNFQFNLSSDYVTGEAGDTLTYSLVSGPRWMAISANGVISGVPTHGDIAKYTAVIRVTDGEMHNDANANGEVIQRFQGPVISSSMPAFVVKEGAILTQKLNDPQYITNPDGGDLTFGPPSLADWVTLSSDGTLIAKPTHANVGDASFAFVVSSPHGSTNGTLHLRVLGNGTGPAPVWTGQQIELTMPAGKAYQGTIAGLASDPAGKKLTFSKVDGKMWLTIGADGTVTAFPSDSDTGVFRFTISACNTDSACASEPLVVTVTGAGPAPDDKTLVVKLGDNVAGAHAENLWVVDNSTVADAIDTQLKASIGTYFDNVKTISQAGVYLSSDPDQYDGVPIHATDQSTLLLPTDGDITANFISRMATSHSPDTSGNFNNSPIWSMYRFYRWAPKLADIYHKGYFVAGEPMEVMIVTQQTDHYKSYAPDAASTVYDFLQQFRTLHRNEKLPFRVSVIAPPPLGLTEKAASPGDATAYQVLATQTAGDYYSVQAAFDMKAALANYGNNVTFRANAYAHKTVPLNGTPTDAASIKVMLGAHVLAGNTGANSDLWRYDSANNQILLNWAVIDSRWVLPGSDLTITFRSNN